MSVLSMRDGRQLHYRVDDYTDPWSSAETVLLIHGLAESGRVWFAWVPGLGRHYRVIRPDLSGFGQSSPLADGDTWSVDDVADDLARLLDHLGVARAHVIGQRAGGAIALNLAARHPNRVASLVLISAPIALPQSRGNKGAASWREELVKDGVAGLTRRTMHGRLGNAPEAQKQWWIDEMSRTALGSMMAAAAAMEQLDLWPLLAGIEVPALLVTTDTSTLVPLADMVAAREKMPHARLMVLASDSYHLAATEPEACLEAALRFIEANA